MPLGITKYLNIYILLNEDSCHQEYYYFCIMYFLNLSTHVLKT